MGKKPQISIIIVNYNTFDYTYNCICSILAKTKNVSFEIIVVDNASQNFKKEKLLELSCSIKIILNDKNLGFAKANNIGIRESSGQVLLLLNNDTYLINDAISLTYLELKKDPNISVAGCKLLNEDQSWQRSFYEFPSITLQAKKILRINNKPVDINKKQPVPWLTGAFLMFRKSNLQYFPRKELNDDFFMYCEDIQWGFNFKKNGLLSYYLPKGIVVHYHGKSSSYKSDLKKKLKYYYPNLAKLLVKEYGLIYSKIYLFLVVLTFATAKEHFSWNQTFKPFFKIWFNIKS